MRRGLYVTPISALAFTLSVISLGACASEEGKHDQEADSLAVHAVFENGSYTFPGKQQCSNNRQTTVSAFLASAFLALQDHPAKASRFDVDCQSVENDENLHAFYSEDFFPDSVSTELQSLDPEDQLSQCSVGAYFSQGELVWSRAVQVLVNTTRGTDIQGSLRCIVIP